LYGGFVPKSGGAVLVLYKSPDQVLLRRVGVWFFWGATTVMGV